MVAEGSHNPAVLFFQNLPLRTLWLRVFCVRKEERILLLGMVILLYFNEC